MTIFFGLAAGAEVHEIGGPIKIWSMRRSYNDKNATALILTQMASAAEMWRVGIDVGGTTDAVLLVDGAVVPAGASESDGRDARGGLRRR
jgi:hypothetical protein